MHFLLTGSSLVDQMEHINDKMYPWTRPIFDIFQEYFTQSEIEPLLTDFNSRDFRPINNSNIVSQGTTVYSDNGFTPSAKDSPTEDIGAMKHNGEIWKAGITWNDTTLTDEEYVNTNRLNFYDYLQS